MGVFTWQDGSTYEGFWQGGKKAGVGVFRPAPHTQGVPGSDPSVRPAAVAAQQQQAAGAGDGPSPPRSPLGSPTAADAPLDSPAAATGSLRQIAAFASGGAAGGAAAADS